LFVLAAGVAGAPLTSHERAALGPNAQLDALSSDSLAALGAAGADVVVVPSPSSRATLERDPALAARASDQPIVAVRFGCDEAPHDPSSDPALVAPYGPETPAGKAESRRALARRTSLALGPRTLLLTVAPLTAAKGGKALLEALARVVRLDVAVAIPAGGERALTDQVAVLGIEHPGKIAVVPDGGAAGARALLAGADALLLTDADDHTGRAAGLALRYGVLPLVPESGADADYLVDYDVASATGCALVYATAEPYQLEAVTRRALSLRADADAWQKLVKALMLSAPRWSSTAAMLEALEPPPETPAVIAT
jgi:glycogen synthase